MKKFIGEVQGVPLTPAVQCSPWLFLSGQVSTNEDGSIPEGIEAQTDLVLRQLQALARSASYELSDFVKTTIFIRDISQFQAMNAVYAKYFPEKPPARSTVQAEVAIAADVEIEAIAMKTSPGDDQQGVMR